MTIDSRSPYTALFTTRAYVAPDATLGADHPLRGEDNAEDSASTDSNTSVESSFALDDFAMMSPEALAQALVAQLASSAADSRNDHHAAAQQRFAAAEAAIDHARESARATLIGSLIGGVGSLVSSVTSVVSASHDIHASGSDAPPPAAGSEAAPASASTHAPSAASRRLDAIGSLAETALGMTQKIMEFRASRSDLRSQAARLESERAEEEGTQASQSADREQSLRDQLVQQLEALMQQRHQTDERAMAQPR